MTRILICSDESASTTGFAKLMQTMPAADDDAQTRIVNAQNLLHTYDDFRPDLVMIGAAADQGGIDAVRKLLEHNRSARVALYGQRRDSPAAAVALTLGAVGFLRWDGSEIVPPRVSQHSATEFPHGPRAQDLTPRERQMLEALSDGSSNLEIARSHFLAEDTVKTHIRRLFRKIGARDRAQAVAIGFRIGVLT